MHFLHPSLLIRNLNLCKKRLLSKWLNTQLIHFLRVLFVVFVQVLKLTEFSRAPHSPALKWSIWLNRFLRQFFFTFYINNHLAWIILTDTIFFFWSGIRTFKCSEKLIIWITETGLKSHCWNSKDAPHSKRSDFSVVLNYSYDAGFCHSVYFVACSVVAAGDMKRLRGVGC